MNYTGTKLAEGRLAIARERLKETQSLLRGGFFKGAVTRSYYASFAAMRALLALKRVDSKTHKGVLYLFHEHYVKTGLFPKDFAVFAGRAKNLRELADYDELAEVSADNARAEYAAAAKFVAAVEKFMKESKPAKSKDERKAKR